MRILRLTQSPDAGGHRVEMALEAPGMARRTATARVTFEVTAGDQELIRWYLEDYPQLAADIGTRGIARRAERLLADLGGQLFGALFDATPGTRRLWDAVQSGLDGTRVEIVTGVAGATALPWELLRDPETGQALALQAAALVRAHPQAAQAPHMPAPEAAALRVLLVISRPRAIDVAFRSVASQLARLQAGDGGVLQLDVLRPPGFARLATVLHAARDAGAPYHVVHFDGHGVWADPDDQGWLRESAPGAAGWSLVSPSRPGAHGYLLFEDPQRPGWLQLADGPALGRLLADAAVPLLVLNACRSAHAEPPAVPMPGTADPHGRIRAYGSLAQEVMDAGVAGVVAMRYNVYVGTAARFTADVYAGLLAGQPLGAAVTAARRQLAASPAAVPASRYRTGWSRWPTKPPRCTWQTARRGGTARSSGPQRRAVSCRPRLILGSSAATRRSWPWTGRSALSPSCCCTGKPAAARPRPPPSSAAGTSAPAACTAPSCTPRSASTPPWPAWPGS